MKTTYITILGERHPLCFSLSAVEEIAEEFGDMEEMTKTVTDSTDLMRQLKGVRKLLDILIRAGRRHFELTGQPLPPEIKGDVADLIDMTDPGAIDSIFAAIGNDSEREIEATPPKNTEPTQE